MVQRAALHLAPGIPTVLPASNIPAVAGVPAKKAMGREDAWKEDPVDPHKVEYIEFRWVINVQIEGAIHHKTSQHL